MLPDRSVLIGQKLVENAKIEKFKCDIFSNFQTMCLIAKLLAVKIFPLRQEGVPLFHNAEVAPPRTQDLKSGDNTKTESQLSVLTLSPGESLTICNKYEKFKVLPH